jgi:hypothetical protein
MRVIHVVNTFGQEPRHIAARKNWDILYAQGVVPVHCTDFDRNAKQIGDPRALPYLKDLLAHGVEAAGKSNLDVILWGNDDTGLAPGILDWCHGVQSDGARSMRRNEAGHIGREIFAFTVEWLDNQWNKIPDFIPGAPCFDLALAALIRKFHGIQSTLENLHIDIWPAETHERLALHEPHPSAWAGKNEHVYKANLWNKCLANEWFVKNNIPIKL